MKKVIAMALALLLLVALTACGGNNTDVDPNLAITKPTDSHNGETEGEKQDQPQDQLDAAKDQVFSFTWQGVTMVPGQPFDASVLPEPASVYQVPSCAVEGTDNVYNYETFEVTAFKDSNGETIYCIYFIDPNLKTAEGLATGDPLADAIAIYGTDYTVDGTAYVYTRGNTQLRLITQDENVISIEYLLDTAA